jgi:hypothetical protein
LTAFCTSTAARSWLQTHGPVAGVRRRVIEQSLQAGELGFDRRGHGFRNILRGGTGIEGLDLHSGRRDLGIAGDRKQPDGKDAKQRNDQADDDGEDRPLDEEVVDLTVLGRGAG